MTHRPLTPLERAILRAVVELGDDAYRIPIFRRVKDAVVATNGFAIGASLWRLENEGYLKCADMRNEKGETGSAFLWRPACDLTAALGAEEQT